MIVHFPHANLRIVFDMSSSKKIFHTFVSIRGEKEAHVERTRRTDGLATVRLPARRRAAIAKTYSQTFRCSAGSTRILCTQNAATTGHGAAEKRLHLGHGGMQERPSKPPDDHACAINANISPSPTAAPGCPQASGASSGRRKEMP